MLGGLGHVLYIVDERQIITILMAKLFYNK